MLKNHMYRSLPGEMLLTAILLQPLHSTAAPQADAIAERLAAMQWGDVAGGLQLHLDIGQNTSLFTGTQLLLGMNILVRNVSDAPVPVNFDESTYDFEYEIDGTWYAFVARNHTLTPVTATRAWITASAGNHPDLRSTIGPGAVTSTGVGVPLGGRSRYLQLFAITANGPGARFEPKPGPHVVRVRPGRTLDATRPSPVSNAVTVTFQTPLRIDTSAQVVTFMPARDMPLGNLRSAAGPADGQAFLREVLARPPRPVPGLINPATLQILPPLPFYDLWLPRGFNAPAPTLPTTTSSHRYFVRSGDEAVTAIQLESTRSGLALGPLEDSEPLFSGLQRVAALAQVRGGDYEPRLLRIVGTRGTSPLLLLWLRSTSDRPDLFYWPRDPKFRGWTLLESDRVYGFYALLKAAQTLPVAPRHDEAWAVAAALACAKAKPKVYTEPLLADRAQVEIGLSARQDRIVWYVFIPSPEDPDVLEIPASGVAFTVDEADGSCGLVMRE